MDENAFRHYLARTGFKDRWWIAINGAIQEDPVDLHNAFVRKRSEPRTPMHLVNAEEPDSEPEWREITLDGQTPPVRAASPAIPRPAATPQPVASAGSQGSFGPQPGYALDLPDAPEDTTKGGNGFILAAAVCLAVSLILLAIPLAAGNFNLFAGIAGPFSLAAFVLAIVALVKGQVAGGIAVLILSLVLPPVVAIPVGIKLLADVVEQADEREEFPFKDLEQNPPQPGPEMSKPFISELIRGGSDWRYLDDGSNLGTTWTSPNFSDQTWKIGTAKLGYSKDGEDDERTELDFGPDPDKKTITYYFRHRFTATQTDTIRSLTLDILRDDGAIVYLNGVEVARSNMPDGPVGYRTFASEIVSGPAEERFFFFDISPSHLKEGENVIAVEIHQQRLESSDLSFDLKLRARQ